MSLKAYLIEEAYEVVEAIESGAPTALEEELGDLLFQVIFHAQIASEQHEFTMADVLQRLGDKMVRRHPHVFGDATVATPGEALAQWEAIKQREAEQPGARRSVLEGVPRSLPALLRAQRVQTKAARVHFDWPNAQAAWGKVEEEVREAGEVLATGDLLRVREELGDLMFSLVNVARLSGFDAEDALQATIQKFRRRFIAMEATLAAGGTPVSSASAEQLERAWEAVKTRETR